MNLTLPEQPEGQGVKTYTQGVPVCSEVKEDGPISSGNTSPKSKYFVKRMPQIASHIRKLWFVWRREDNGDEIFVKDFLREEEASAFSKKLNGIWAIHHPDFPNPHKCCKGLWVPAEHRWDHAINCPR